MITELDVQKTVLGTEFTFKSKIVTGRYKNHEYIMPNIPYKVIRISDRQTSRIADILTLENTKNGAKRFIDSRQIGRELLDKVLNIKHPC